MFNNYSYRQFSVTGGPTFFNFPPVSSTVRMQPAIQAWAATGATVNQVEPDPGNDGIFVDGLQSNRTRLPEFGIMSMPCLT